MIRDTIQHDDDQPDGDEPGELGFERVVGAEREVRPGVPDEDRDQQEADQQNEGAALEKCEHSSINRKWVRRDDV